MAQSKLANNWVIGASPSYFVQFDTIVPKVSLHDTIGSDPMFIGSSCISDSNGRLILVSAGMSLKDSNFNIISSADTLGGHAYAQFYQNLSPDMQHSLILPFENGIYYFVYGNVTDSVFNNIWLGSIGGDAVLDELMYAKIDLKTPGAGGNGTLLSKDVKLLENETLSKTQMMACRHGNGIDWWLFKQARGTNKIFKFLFTKDSVFSYGYQVFSGGPVYGTNDVVGQLAFSLDGTKFSSVLGDGNMKAFVSDFDRCTGILSNPRIIDLPILSMHNSFDTTLMSYESDGIAFSPNNQYLYVAQYSNVVQLDLLDSNPNTQWSVISGLDTAWEYFAGHASLHYSPDSVIYIGNLGWGGAQHPFLSAIKNPNGKGSLCNFGRGLRFSGPTALSPPNMPNYNLGGNGNCIPASYFEIDNYEGVTVFPNPTTDKIEIMGSMNQGEKKLYNEFGQLLLKTTKSEIDMSSLSKGIYYIRCEGRYFKIVLE